MYSKDLQDLIDRVVVLDDDLTRSILDQKGGEAVRAASQASRQANDQLEAAWRAVGLPGNWYDEVAGD